MPFDQTEFSFMLVDELIKELVLMGYTVGLEGTCDWSGGVSWTSTIKGNGLDDSSVWVHGRSPTAYGAVKIAYDLLENSMPV